MAERPGNVDSYPSDHAAALGLTATSLLRSKAPVLK
jgi:membrane-associated phospholipid phosphatase